jgi:hypothetical protein
MPLSASAIETVINIAGSILDRFIKPPKKRQYPELIRDDLVSIGLATGYFFNFLDMTAKTIQYSGGLDIYSSTVDNKPDLNNQSTRFLKDNIKVEIIMPKRLHSDNFAACEKEFTQYKRGFFYSEANGRYYGINYAIMETNKDSVLRIIDYARPVIAAKPFYEQILMVATEAADKWEQTQVAEIAAFKKTLDILLNRSYGTLPNKLNYMDIG